MSKSDIQLDSEGFFRPSNRQFKPHIQNIQIQYTNFSGGLDWKSRIRSIPAPSNHQEALFYPPMTSSMRHFEQHNAQSNDEYLLYPSRSRNKTFIAPCTSCDVIIATPSSTHVTSAVSDDVIIRSSTAAEYSKNFFKINSKKIRSGKLLNLQSEPKIEKYSKKKSFKEKEEVRKLEEEIKDVKNLSNWKPSISILQETF